MLIFFHFFLISFNPFPSIISPIIWPQGIFSSSSSTIHLNKTPTPNWPLTVPQICHALFTFLLGNRSSFSFSPKFFPDSSEKPTDYYLLLQTVEQNYGYFTFILQFHSNPMFLAFLPFSSLHSKDPLVPGHGQASSSSSLMSQTLF